jgi:hypothetical protein
MFEFLRKIFQKKPFCESGNVVKLTGVKTTNPDYDKPDQCYVETLIFAFDELVRKKTFFAEEVVSAMILDGEPKTIPGYITLYYLMLLTLRDGTLLKAYVPKENISRV